MVRRNVCLPETAFWLPQPNAPVITPAPHVVWYELPEPGDSIGVGVPFNVYPTTNTTYRAVVSDSGGCYQTDSADIEITVVDLPPPNLNVTAWRICNAGPASNWLTVTGAAFYRWEPAARVENPTGSETFVSYETWTEHITPSDPWSVDFFPGGTYTYTVCASNQADMSCATCQEVVVEFPPQPSVSADNDGFDLNYIRSGWPTTATTWEIVPPTDPFAVATSQMVLKVCQGQDADLELGGRTIVTLNPRPAWWPGPWPYEERVVTDGPGPDATINWRDPVNACTPQPCSTAVYQNVDGRDTVRAWYFDNAFQCVRHYSQIVDVHTPIQVVVQDSVASNEPLDPNGWIRFQIVSGDGPFTWQLFCLPETTVSVLSDVSAFPAQILTSDFAGLDNCQYQLVVTDANGCSTSELIDLSSFRMAAKVQASDFLEVYPNPTAGRLTVRWNLQDIDHVDLELTDVTGRSLRGWRLESSQGEKVVSLEDLPSGLYLCRFRTRDELLDVKKIILAP